MRWNIPTKVRPILNTYGYVKSRGSIKSWGPPAYLWDLGPQRSKTGQKVQNLIKSPWVLNKTKFPLVFEHWVWIFIKIWNLEFIGSKLAAIILLYLLQYWAPGPFPLYFTTILGLGAVPPNSGAVPPSFYTTDIVLHYLHQYWVPGPFPLYFTSPGSVPPNSQTMPFSAGFQVGFKSMNVLYEFDI